MEYYGEILKKLRESKDLSLNDVSEKGFISASTLSNIENGKSDLTIDKLFFILNKLNTPLDVFQSYFNVAPVNFRAEFNLVIKARKRKSIRELKKLREEFREKSSLIERYRHLEIFVNIHIAELIGQQPDRNELKEIEKYLKTQYSWHYYDITLFNNTFYFFDIEFVKICLNRVEKQYNIYTQVIWELDKKALFLLNVINYFIRKNEFQIAKYRIDKLKIELHGTYLVYEIEKLNYLEGKLFIKTANVKKGKRKAEQAIQRMEEYGWTNDVTILRNSLEELLKKEL